MTNKCSFPVMCFIVARRHLRRPSFWLIVCLGLLLQFVLGGLVFPDIDNTRVGIMSNNGGPCANEVVEKISSGASGYDYIVYNDLEEMRADVSTGYLDCAFVFDGRMETADLDNLENAYTCIISTSSTKSYMVKEEVFSIVFETLSGNFLKQLSDRGQIFADPDPEKNEALLDANRQLRTGDNVLSVYLENALTGERHNVMERDPKPAEEAAAGLKTGNAAALSALAILIFAAALFFADGRFRDDSAHMRCGLRPGRRAAFLFADTLGPLLCFAIALMAFCALQGAFAGISPIRVALAFLAGVPAAALWALLFTGLFRRESICLFAVTAVLIVAAVLTAADSFSIGLLTRQFGWIRCCFPSTWFTLLLLG